MATAEEVLATLKSIDASLLKLVAHFGIGAQPHAPAQDSRSVPEIATAADLDSQHGDPIVKAKSPRDWTGDSMQGKHFSECPAEYLDLVASRLDYFAEGEPDPKKARYNRLDSSRAKGWAARIRAGYKPAAQLDAAGDPLTADSIPFALILAVLASASLALSVLA